MNKIEKSEETKKWQDLISIIDACIANEEWSWNETLAYISTFPKYDGNNVIFLFMGPTHKCLGSAFVYQYPFVFPQKDLTLTKESVLKLCYDADNKAVGVSFEETSYLYCLHGQIDVFIRQNETDLVRDTLLTGRTSIRIEPNQIFRLEPTNNTVMIWSMRNITD